MLLYTSDDDDGLSIKNAFSSSPRDAIACEKTVSTVRCFEENFSVLIDEMISGTEPDLGSTTNIYNRARLYDARAAQIFDECKNKLSHLEIVALAHTERGDIYIYIYRERCETIDQARSRVCDIFLLFLLRRTNFYGALISTYATSTYIAKRSRGEEGK